MTDTGPELPSGWWGTLLIALAWLLKELWPKVKEWFQERREDKLTDGKLKEVEVKVDVKRAAAESRIKQEEQDHIDERWQRYSDVLLKQVNDLIDKQTAFLQRLADQDDKIEQLQLAYDECTEREARHIAQMKERDELIAKMQQEIADLKRKVSP